MVTLSTLQPRVGFPVTATVADPDNVDCGQRLLAVVPPWLIIPIMATDLTTFEPATLPRNECDDNNTAHCSIKGTTSAAYVHVDADVDMTGYGLRAVATYTDGNGDEQGRCHRGSSERGPGGHAQQSAGIPRYRTLQMEGRQTAQELTVGENVPENTLGVSP